MWEFSCCLRLSTQFDTSYRRRGDFSHKEARNKDRRKGLGDMEFLENKVKNTLRKKFNITAKSYKELLKGQGKRTKQVDSAAKKKVAADLFSDSDLDD